ncbi:MAG: guanylate kinase [Kiritimatiellia bacterium]
MLLLLSAPSGGGKTTLCCRLREEFPDIFYSISCTTRRPRQGEVDGRDYFFLDMEEFRRRADRGALLESALVHDYAYGTPRAPVEEALRAGRDVLMDIDVQGAARIRDLLRREPQSLLGRSYVDVFIMPPDEATLRRRLEGRAQDDAATIERRLHNALEEMRWLDQYQYALVNDNLEAAYDRLRAILLAEHCRVIAGRNA